MKDRPYRKIRQLEVRVKMLEEERQSLILYRDLSREFYDCLCTCVGKNSQPTVQFWVERFKRLLK